MNILISKNKYEKKLKAYFSAFLIFGFVFAQIAMPLSVAYAVEAGDEQPVENVQEITKPEEEPQVQQDSVNNIQPMATIVAKKVVCSAESDLPNWGAGGPDITSTTASDYVASHQSCHLEPWTFEWAPSSTPNPGSNELSGGASWTAFTDSVSVPVPSNPSYIWVREQLPDTYIPFSDDKTAPFDDNVSAEMYCGTDVLNYDNYDRVDNMVADHTYNCVGFNVLKVQPQQCDFVSDTTNITQTNSNATETWTHSAWVHSSLLGNVAKWIWNAYKVLNPTSDETETFTKSFNVSGPISSAMLQIAADNGYIVKINGDVVIDKFTIEHNYESLNGPIDVSSYLDEGTNTIEITVKNFALADSTSESNPAGLLYKLSVSAASCSDVPPPPPQCDANALTDFYSDTSTQVDGHDAVPVDFIHEAWITSIPGATWIWSEANVVDPEVETTKVFTKHFNIIGTPKESSITLATDNTNVVEVNGTEICADETGQTFYGTPAVCTIPASVLVNGDNELKITVKNWTNGPGDNLENNPAGLLYKLSINNDECVVPPPTPQTSTVTMCKTDDAESATPLSGWTLMLKGDSVEDLSVNSNSSSGTNTTNPLIAGVSYIAQAVGTWLNQGGANPVDTEYSTTDGWTTHMDGYTGYSTDILELQIDNKFDPNSNWGAYNPLHKYAQSFIPTGTTSNFRIFDGTGTTQNESWFGDNSGSLDVNISKGYAGITGKDGCVVFNDVPYGQYTVDEIAQDGWSNVSGLVDVSIDQPTENFTVVNHDDSIIQEPTTGSIEITKYVCPTDTSVVRSANGVNGTIPEGCELQEGKTFGYVHGEQTDANSPYPELGESLTEGGSTNVNGKLIISDLDPTGRYLVAESDGSGNKLSAGDILGLYCEGDGDTSDNNDNQELTFVTAGESTHCVAYNKAQDNGGGGDEETTSFHTTIVKDSDMNGWAFINDQTNTPSITGSFATGPDTAPLGNGSANLVISNSSQGEYFGTAYPGTLLSQITSLKYSTYRTSGDPALATSIQLNIDKDSTDADLSWQGRLVYEPYFTQTVSTGVWQDWDALNDSAGTGTGNWWFSNGALGTFTGCIQADPCTWAEVLAALPNGAIHSTLGAIGFKAGSGWSSFDGNVDKLVLGIKTGLNTHTETYDFEPTVAEQETFVCSDGIDNDNDGLIDYPADPGCVDAQDNDESNIPNGSSKIIGGGGGGLLNYAKQPEGEVLGATTSCGIYLDDFLKLGKKNNKEQVKKLQTFLNDYLHLDPKIKVDGIFGLNTFKAVVKFQESESQFVLKPWVGLTLKDAKKGTGWVYKTTVTRINNIMCPELNLSIPPLTI